MSDRKQIPLPISRRQKNTADRPFSLIFLERVYDGPPRCWTKEWQKHHNTPAGINGDRLEREEAVKERMRMAHDWRRLFNEDISYLITCTNLKCPFRPWTTVYFKKSRLSMVQEADDVDIDGELSLPEREDLRKQIQEGLAR